MPFVECLSWKSRNTFENVRCSSLRSVSTQPKTSSLKLLPCPKTDRTGMDCPVRRGQAKVRRRDGSLQSRWKAGGYETEDTGARKPAEACVEELQQQAHEQNDREVEQVHQEIHRQEKGERNRRIRNVRRLLAACLVLWPLPPMLPELGQRTQASAEANSQVIKDVRIGIAHLASHFSPLTHQVLSTSSPVKFDKQARLFAYLVPVKRFASHP